MCCRQKTSGAPALGHHAVPASNDALATAFPVYYTVLRLFFQYRLETAGRGWKSRLFVGLAIAALVNVIFGLINWGIYGHGTPLQVSAAQFVRDSSMVMLVAPLLGLYICSCLLPKLRELQPALRSYSVDGYKQLHRCHRRTMVIGVALPIIGLIVALAGYSSSTIAKQRHILFPTPCFINAIYHSLFLSVALGACAPLAWSVYLFTVLVDMQAINVFRHMLMHRDPAMAAELLDTTPAASRKILSKAPLFPPLRRTMSVEAGKAGAASPAQSHSQGQRKAAGIVKLVTTGADNASSSAALVPSLMSASSWVVSNPTNALASPLSTTTPTGTGSPVEAEARRMFSPQPQGESRRRTWTGPRSGATGVLTAEPTHGDANAAAHDGTAVELVQLSLPGPSIASPAAGGAHDGDGRKLRAAATGTASPLAADDDPESQSQLLTVDQVLRVQRALQQMVRGHSNVWIVPTALGLVAAAIVTLLAALNIIANATSGGVNDINAAYTWMVVGPVAVLLMLTPGVTLNSAWTDILRSPEMDWSMWHAAERAWLTSRFTLSPVTFPVVFIAFDWLTLVKLLGTSLAPLIVSQAMKLRPLLEATLDVVPAAAANATNTTA